MGSNPLLDAALQYAGRGWRVLPLHSVWHKDKDTAVCTCRRGGDCPSKGKHPRFDKILIPNGLKDASADRAIIEAWWAKWPQANVGIATGNGLTVMDIDGPQGQQELLALLAAHPEGFGNTLGARTGSGGHLYFSCEGPGSNAKGHLHIRGEAGYVVAPPSLHHSGRRYEWVNQEPAREPPEWLAAWFHAGGSGESGRAPQQRPAGEAAATGTSLALGAPPPWLAARHAGKQEVAAAHPAHSARLADAATIATPWTAHEEARLRSALRAIPAEGYDTWLRVGMALHALGWTDADGFETGYAIWDEWSATLKEKYDPETIDAKWISFGKRGSGGITVASVYHLAAEHGWKGEVSTGEHGPGMNGHSFKFGISTAAGGPIFIDLNDKGKPRATCVNSRIAIRALGLVCKYNTFRERLEIGGQTLKQWSGEHGDKVTHVLRGLIHQNFGFDPGSQPAHDAVVQECLDSSYDPVADYLDGLEWDRVPRLGHWLTKYLGAQPSQLNSTIGALGLIAACRRVRVPGAKFDAITVLISDEGFGKSKAIEILAGEYFCDQQILNLDEKAQQEMMQGVWLYEIADLAGMGKADVDKVKAFASRRVDRARPAYAKNREDRPRRCVFYATTNMQNFLKSQTGNRRFWPVQVGGRVKEADLRNDRDQLWAEASEIERAGVPLELPEALWGEAAALQLERMEIDPWDDILAHIDPGPAHECSTPEGSWKEYRVSSQDLISLNLGISADRQTDATSKRLGHTMRRLGWDGPKLLRVQGRDGKTIPARGFSKKCNRG